MQTTSKNDIPAAQAKLIHVLDEQEALYATATQTIAEMQQAGDASMQSGLARLQSQLGKIKIAGLAVQNANEEWQNEGSPRCDQLKTSLARQEERIVEFLNKVDTLKNSFHDLKARLEPRLDTDVTRRSMQQAYQRSMRTG